MKNVKVVSDKYLIVYYSLSGNTKRVAEIITESLIGEDVKVFPLTKGSNFMNVNIEFFTHVFIGSPTYGNGNTPNIVRNYLRYLLKENNFNLPSFSVFGSGESQWKHYGRAVDEMEYHLSKKTKVQNKLKIEQYPMSKLQIEKIRHFVEEVTNCYN